MNRFSHPVTSERLEANWRGVLVELDAPPLSRTERALRRVGIPGWTSRLLVATPALRRAWFLAVGLTVVIGIGSTDAASPRDSLFTLLLVAPMLPVLGVALAYGPDADPAHESTVATPASGLRLVLIRAAAVVAVSMIGIGAAALLAPALPAMAAAWLIPSLALTAVCLAAMTVTAPRRAATATVVGWVIVVLVARRAADDPLAAFTAIGQAAAAAAFVVGMAVAWLRRDRFELLVTS